MNPPITISLEPPERERSNWSNASTFELVNGFSSPLDNEIKRAIKDHAASVFFELIENVNQFPDFQSMQEEAENQQIEGNPTLDMILDQKLEVITFFDDEKNCPNAPYALLSQHLTEKANWLIEQA